MTALDRWRVVCALVVCLGCLAAIGGVSDGVVAQSAETNGTVNETVRHERPQSAADSGDTKRLRRWLGGRLSERLESSTLALNEGDYERAQSVLGDDFDSRLSQFAEVAGETGDVGGTYREVRDSQRELANQAQKFEAASERYDRARENGNSGAAREAAREMNRLGDQISETGSNTTQGYETLENQTDVDTSTERTAVTNLTSDVRERQEEIRDATFVETTLDVTDATRVISFTDPLQVTGKLTDENGSVLANRTITVQVAGRPQSVATDEEGQFSLSYRPRTLRANASSVEVAYVPRNESVYLGSNASVPVDVERVQPTLRVQESTAETAFGHPVGASVAVTVDGESVDDVPVVADVAGYRLGRTTAGADGTARVETGLPATVPAGDQQLRASIPLQNRAIASANGSVPVTVEATETNLNVSGERRGEEATVTGRLVTADGRPVRGQQIQVTRNGTALTTVETGPNGGYSATVSLRSTGGATSAPVQVGANFDGTGTNLESARATTVFVVEGRYSQGWLALFREWLPIDWPWSVVAAATLAVFALGGGLAWRRRSEADHVGGDLPESNPAEPRGDSETSDDHLTALQRAETFLERDAAGAAVRATYAAIRERYAPDEAPETHWELLDVAQSLGEEERTALERVTNTYEREAFAPGSVDENVAEAALDAAVELVEHHR